jgi:hypothetical protein
MMHSSRGRATALRPALFSLLAVLHAGCTVHASEPVEELRYGTDVPVGHGTARTYVIASGDRIEEVGVALSDGALHGLPTAGGHHAASGAGTADLVGAGTGVGTGDRAGDAHHGREDVEYLLEMPAGTAAPYRFVELGWNPKGHPPAGVYDEPHFDVHFYTISLEERNAIDPAREDFRERANRVPQEALVPAGYLPHHVLEGAEPAALTVPRMGMHWVDPSAPEFNGGSFTATMLHGSWDGRFVFEEPMVSRAFLLERPNSTLLLPHHPSGVSPRTLRVYWDADTAEYRIALRDLDAR